MLVVKTASLALTIVFAQILFYLNIYLLYAVFCTKKIIFRPNLLLFYCRFLVDVGHMLSVTINKSYFLAVLLSDNFAIEKMAFFTTCPSVIFATMRSIIGFLITADRLVAIYFPVWYHLYWKKLSIPVVALILIISAMFNQYILFGYCKYSIDVPLRCDDFKCTVNTCYYNYYISQEEILHFVIGSMTTLLCIRLFIRYLTAKSEISKFLSQATRVALLDSFTIVVFNAFPSFLYAQFPATNFETFGPLISFFKRVGALIDAVLIFRIFMRERNVASNVISPIS